MNRYPLPEIDGFWETKKIPFYKTILSGKQKQFSKNYYFKSILNKTTKDPIKLYRKIINNTQDVYMISFEDFDLSWQLGS